MMIYFLMIKILWDLLNRFQSSTLLSRDEKSAIKRGKVVAFVVIHNMKQKTLANHQIPHIVYKLILTDRRGEP